MDTLFVIRDEHLRAFTRAAHEAYVDRMAAWVQVRFPKQAASLGSAGLLSHIEGAMARAAGHDIRAERDVAAFIRMTFTIRPDFDTHRATRWAQAILTDRTRPASVRVQKLADAARANGFGRRARAETSVSAAAASGDARKVG